ncbi:PrpF domain-containing protein [Arthrobacter sp. S41]|uniref:PrpF domain-containing protein n=1 Tax=Arthrobacter sp. S41 TaxID=2509721 RepID=UPI001F5EB03F|nr:PrpF domain-containing protein [Arthrobacter sp. S41]
MKQAVTATWMRGGTSKCWVFEKSALQVPGYTTDEVLLRLFGSPDSRQIDGVGGGSSTTSKAVILEPSQEPGIDVEYTFAEVGIDQAVVDWGSNCGNCSAVIAPYALKRGWVQAKDQFVTVHIRNTNTGQLLVEQMNLDGSEFSALIPGVPFTAQGVEIGFLDPAGATTGKLFPDRNETSTLSIHGDTSEQVQATLIDAGAPIVIIDAQSARLEGIEFSHWLTESLDEMPRLDRIRRAGAVAMGLADSPAQAERAIPKLAIVQAADTQNHNDLLVMMLSMGAPHPALAITGSIGLTLAAQHQGTVLAKLLKQTPGEFLKLQTPAGQITTWQRQIDGTLVVGTTRTARVLAESTLSFDPISTEHGEPTVTHLELPDASEDQLLPDPEPHRRRTVFASVTAFAVLGLGATLVGGGLLNPPATTADGDYSGKPLRWSFHWPKVEAPIPGPDLSAKN